MISEWGSFVFIGALAVAICGALGGLPGLRVIRHLLVIGAVMRIVGVLARYTMIFDIYGGSDAVGYFNSGSIIADHFRALDFSIIGSGQWSDREWGTQAVRYASGFVLTFVGPSMRGSFLVFSLVAFAGLVCTAVAVGRSGQSSSMSKAALLMFLWPTLWFWPSSIGKEAILILGTGLVTMGYVGQRERIHWIPMVSGFAVTMAVRPHIAGVLAIAICVAEWTSHEWTFRRVLQSIVASAGALWLITRSLDMMGLAGADLDTLQAFVVHTGEQTNQGGSSFAKAGMAAAIPMSFVNILCRPFITEASGSMALVTSLEMMAFWGLVIANARQLSAIVRSWRSNRLLRFAVPFAILYVLMIGMTFQNFGIIARQRALVMPALLVLCAITPTARARRVSADARPTRRLWRPSAAGTPFAAAGRPS